MLISQPELRKPAEELQHSSTKPDPLLLLPASLADGSVKICPLLGSLWQRLGMNGWGASGMMGSELRLGWVPTTSLSTEFCDADRHCVIFVDPVILHVYSTQQFSKCFHTRCFRWDKPRQICTHVLLLLLRIFAECKVLLPSAWLLTLGAWTSDRSIS